MSPSNQSLPPILRPRFSQFPAELTSRAQWVLWKAVWKQDAGKYNKIPYNARTLQQAKSTDPATWSDFETVKAAYEKNPARPEDPQKGFAGVGYVLSEDDPFCGVDLDHVIDNRVLSKNAEQIVSDLATYAEISPSGTGVRAFAIATLPPGGRKHGDTECYESGRYLTVTGRKLEKATPNIEARQAEIEAFHAAYFPAPEKPKRKSGAVTTGLDADDDELLSKATTAKNNGAKIAALIAGSTAGYAGHSEADFALCSLLAFWTGDDPARLDRLFRRSGLMRDKWDERRYADGSTYGEKTIQRAIEGCCEFYQPPKRKPLNAEEVKQAADSVKGEAAIKPAAPQVESVAVDIVPPPALRTDRGLKEFAPYQIAELLKIDAEAPDTERALAARAVIAFKDTLCHCRELGWLHFNGKNWDSDDRQESRTATEFCFLSHTIRAEAGILFACAADLIKAGRVEDGEAMIRAAKKHLAHVKQVESERFAQSAMILSRAALTVPRSYFDPKPWLIGFPNGVWDHGEWREHRREDYLLHLSPVPVDFDIDQSEWETVLKRITGGDTDLMRTFQETAGYALSGASTFRFLPWSYGPKGSGKSTIGVSLQTVLGEMATALDVALLASDAERGRLGASLVGKRLAVVEEAGNSRIDAELLKMLSGSNMLTVKPLYKEAYTASPRHMVMMVANDPPNMTAYDDALRDRVVALPCNHLLSEGELLVFSDGILIEEVRQNPQSMMIRGFVVWALSGLAAVYAAQKVYRAPAVQKATERFWRDTDPLTEFWDQFEGWQTDKHGRYVLKTAIFTSYKVWAADQGVRRPLANKAWGTACRAYGLEEDRLSDGTRIWRSQARQERLSGMDSLPSTQGAPPVDHTALGKASRAPGTGTGTSVSVIAAFIASECDRAPDAIADFPTLHRAYEAWARATGQDRRTITFSYASFEALLVAMDGIGIDKNPYVAHPYHNVIGLTLRTSNQNRTSPPDEEPFPDDPGTQEAQEY